MQNLVHVSEAWRGRTVSLERLSETEVAYLAGIIDGEGTITLTRKNRGENRRPVVSISSTELSLLLHVRSSIGNGRITRKVCARSHHSPSFAYTVSCRQALALLKRVAPYLRTYRAFRAHLLLNEYLSLTPRNGRYTPAQTAARQDFDRRFFALSVRAKLNSEHPSHLPERCPSNVLKAL
jgi:hypothetical protein